VSNCGWQSGCVYSGKGFNPDRPTNMVQGSFCRRAELMPYAELSGLHNSWDTGGTSSCRLDE
jgi:hypothetical protein